MTPKAQKVGEGSKKYRSFRMCLNLKDYLFKTSRYRSTYMVTTNQKPTIDTQKLERNTSAPVKNHQTTRKETKRRRKE